MSLSDLFQLPPPTITKPIINDTLGDALNVYLANNGDFYPETTNFRCSSISFMCPREYFFNFYNPQPSRFIPKVQLKVELGTLLHKHLQEKILGPMKILKGNWVNLKTKEKIEGFHPEPDRPEEYEYEEYTLKDDKYNLSGHIDGLISYERLKFIETNKNLYKKHFKELHKEIERIETKTYYLLDMKSVSQKNYAAAFTEEIPSYYKTQANLYMNMLGVDKMYFLYFETENYSFFGKIYNKEQTVLDEALRKIETTNNQFLTSEPTHEYRACTNEKDVRARKCPHREACFNYKLNYKELVEKSKYKHSGIKLPIL